MKLASKSLVAKVLTIALLAFAIAVAKDVHGYLASSQQSPDANEKAVHPSSEPQPGAPDRPAEVLAKLQVADEGAGLVPQHEFDWLIAEEGGGACASVTGINLLQTLRVIAGLDPLSNPHRVALSILDKQRALLKGRVSNAQFMALAKSLEQYLPGNAISVEVVSAPNSPYADDQRKWAGATGPDLTTRSKEVKVLSYTVSDKNKVIGRHFVILKDQVQNQITVVDPTKPSKDRRYVTQFEAGTLGPAEHVFLINPPDVPPRTLVYELDTIFKVAVFSQEIAGVPGAATDASVAFVMRRFEETAGQLKHTDDWLSPRAWREKTASFGLPGLDLPADLGGANWPAVKTIEIFRHVGQRNLNFRDIVGGAHVRPLRKSKHAAVLEIVRQVANGKGYVAIAITEPTAGSDMQAIRSTARKVEGGYLLTGTKRFNARLDQATHVIIFTQGTRGQEGKLSAFVTPVTAPGLKIERLTAHGLIGNSYGGLSFKDLFVPDSHLIGEDGDAMNLFFEHFFYWRLMQTATAIGTAQDALRQMAARIKDRHAFGGPIGRFTHLQQPIGQYTTQLDMAWSLTREAAAMLDKGEYRDKKTRALICGLKAEGVEIALSAVDCAMRAFGGEGYSTMVDLGDRLKDLQGLRIADGTTDVMRMEVVRNTYGKEFWEMAIEPKK